MKTFIISEIGINHNGDINIVKKLIDIAKGTGCDAVKFQKRNLDICIPENKKDDAGLLRRTKVQCLIFEMEALLSRFDKVEAEMLEHSNRV